MNAIRHGVDTLIISALIVVAFIGMFGVIFVGVAGSIFQVIG